jgi:hypothetical protein
MKKFAISLLALAAVSTAAFADGSRDDDLRHSGLLKSGYGTQLNGNSTDDYALVAVKTSGGAPTAYELVQQRAAESNRDFNR